jgi:hypothetical protein
LACEGVDWTAAEPVTGVRPAQRRDPRRYGYSAQDIAALRERGIIR